MHIPLYVNIIGETRAYEIEKWIQICSQMQNVKLWMKKSTLSTLSVYVLLSFSHLRRSACSKWEFLGIMMMAIKNNGKH